MAAGNAGLDLKGGLESTGLRRRNLKIYDVNPEAFDPSAAEAGAQSTADQATARRSTAAGAVQRQFYDPTQANQSRDLQLADRDAAAGARAEQLGQINDIRQYVDQGPGPSQAEAQLQAAQSRNMSDAVALARSGRGAGGSAAALRGAQAQRAQIGADTATGLAQVRANEAATWRQQQLQGMGLAQSGLGGVRQADLSQQAATAGIRQGDLSQEGVQLSQAQMNDARAVAEGQLGLGYEGLAQGYTNQAMAARAAEEELRANTVTQSRIANMQGRDQSRAGGLGTVGTIIGGAALLSDRDAKTDIEEIKDILETAKSAKPYKYRYKDEKNGKGEFVGPMAQDLEKSPLGNTLVKKGDDGYRRVDGGRAGLVALSALGEQQREIERIKKMLGRKAA